MAMRRSLRKCVLVPYGMHLRGYVFHHIAHVTWIYRLILKVTFSCVLVFLVKRSEPWDSWTVAKPDAAYVFVAVIAVEMKATSGLATAERSDSEARHMARNPTYVVACREFL